MKKYKGSPGWFKDSHRHSLAAKGIKTGRKIDYSNGFLATGAKMITNPSAFTSADVSSFFIDVIGVSSANIVKAIPYVAVAGVTYSGAKGLHKLMSLYYDNKLSKEALRRKVESAGEGNPIIVTKEDLGDVIDPEQSHVVSVREPGVAEIQYAKPFGPQDITQAPPPDQDKDGVPDSRDWDVDNDGIPNWKDSEGMFNVDNYGGQGVFDPIYNAQIDSDLDGVPDTKDLHPQNPFKSRDWAKFGVSARQFFIHRFKRDPDHPAERAYFNEWEQRFASGRPETYMDGKSLKVYDSLQRRKQKLPRGWKGKGGISVKIVEVKK